jgi:hypothetical protein
MVKDGRLLCPDLSGLAMTHRVANCGLKQEGGVT